MTRKKTIYKWMRITGWGLAVLAVMVLLVSAVRNRRNGLCMGVEVKTKNGGQLFVSDAALLELVNAGDMTGKEPIGQINTRELEDRLERNPWIKNAELFFDGKNILHINVEQREPLLRVIAKNGHSFYMDAAAAVLPLSSSYSARVPVFTSFPANTGLTAADSALAGQMVALAGFIGQDEFWQAQIQQVDIVKGGQFELIPTIGRHRILFGDTSRMENKFSRLYQFYKKVAAVAGFDRYSVLNVQFAGQIVAVSREQSAITVDTAAARNTIQQLLRSNRDVQAGDELNGTGTAVMPDTAATMRMDTVNNRPRRVAPAGTAPKPGARQQPVRGTVQPPKPAVQPPARRNQPARQQPRAVMPRRNGQGK